MYSFVRSHLWISLVFSSSSSGALARFRRSKSNIRCANNSVFNSLFCSSRPLLDFLSSSVGDSSCRMVLSLFIPFWISLVYYLTNPWVSAMLQLELWSVNPWDPWCTTSWSLYFLYLLWTMDLIWYAVNSFTSHHSFLLISVYSLMIGHDDWE